MNNATSEDYLRDEAQRDLGVIKIKSLKKELEKIIKQNNRQPYFPNDYMSGVLDGRVEVADFLLELIENGEI